MLSIEKTQKGDTLFLKYIGSIDKTTINDFKQSLCLEGINHLRIDLANVDFISAEGLSIILDTEYQLEHRKSSIVITEMSQKVKDEMELVNFTYFL